MGKEGFLGIATRRSTNSTGKNSSPFRTPSRKTPAKQLFKRFLCGPSPKKHDPPSVYAETSLEGPIDSNSTSGSPSTEAESSVVNVMKSLPESMPVPTSPFRGEKKERISEVLSSGALSPDNMADDLYLPHSSSSYSDDNAPCTPPMPHFRTTSTEPTTFAGMPMKTPGIAIPTPAAPKRVDDDIDQDHTTTLLFPHPLRAITESPSPQVTRHVHLSHSTSASESHASTTAISEDDDDAFLPDDFKKTKQLYTWDDVQRHVKEAVEEFKKDLEDQHQQELEETVENNLREHGLQWKQDAEAEYARLHSLIKQEQAKSEQKTLELRQLADSISTMEAQLSLQTQEKRRLESKLQALESQFQQDVSANSLAKDFYINQLQEQIQELQTELDDNRSKQPDTQYIQSLLQAKQEADEKVDELERMVLRTQNQIKAMEMSQFNEKSVVESVKVKYEKELQDLQKANRAANDHIRSLQAQMESATRNTSNTEELVVLKSEKTTLERKLREAQEKLDARVAAVDEQTHAYMTQLEEAQARIQILEQQLEESNGNVLNQSTASNSSEVSHEEYVAVKSQVEKLQLMHDRDIREKSRLQSRIQEMKKEMLQSPSKKGKESKLEIGTLTVEVLSSPSETSRQSMPIADSDAMLRRDLATLKAQRDALEEQVQQLQANIAEQSTQQDLEREIRLLKEELDRRTKEFEAEKKKLQAGLSVQEIEEFTTEVENLKIEHAQKMDELRQTLLLDHEEAMKASKERIDELRVGYEQEMANLVQSHNNEKEDLRVQIDQLKEQHEAQIALVRQTSISESEEEIKSLQEKLDRLRIEFEDEKVEIIRTSSRQADELQSKLSQQQQEHDEELEALRERIQSLEMQLDRLQAEATTHAASSVTTQYLQELQAKYEDDIEALKIQARDEASKHQLQLEEALQTKSDLESRIASLEHELEMLTLEHQKKVEEVTRKAKEEMDLELQELEATIKKMEAGDMALTHQIAELQAKTQADKEEYARRVRQVREEHTKEIDDLLKQLDLVEAEHNEKISKIQQLVTEKETVISALGAQLAEAERQLVAKSQERDNTTKRVEELEEEIQTIRADCEHKGREVKRLLAERAKAAEEEAFIREQLCAEAREEMIQRAEEQFEELNSTYKKLKHKFDEAQDKISALELELKAAKKRVDQSKKEKEAREADLATEIAQAKAALASADLNAAKKVKQLRSELQQAKESELELQAKLEEALATSRSVQRTLASVVSEKEKLMEEYRDMKVVCEELMEMVEGQK